jgi:hypothetical protein
MKMRPEVIGMAALLGLSLTAIASAQDIPLKVTYVCNGERIFIDGCNIRDLSDTATCTVAHPDHVLSNGIMAYTSQTRGALKKLLPTCKQPSAEEIAKEKAFAKKVQDKQDAAEKKANAENDAIEARAQAAITGQKPQTPEQRALNRCITSGRLPATCMGNTLMKPFEEIVGSVLPSVGAPLPPGPHMNGNFEGTGSWRIEFDDRFTMTTCGGLDAAQQKYSLELKNNTAMITVPSKPKDIVLTLKPDGTLVGPGPITVYGIITTGHRTEETATTKTNVTEYKNATRVCPPPVLSSKGAAPSAVDIGTGFLKAMFSDGEKGPPTPAGLRMHGSFGGQGGLSLEFYPESAVIACGEAAHAYPYEVQVNGAQPIVKLQDPARPLVLTMKPGGELDSGSGPYEVHGRIITGKNANDDFTFAPLNMTCSLGVLAPGATPPAPPPMSIFAPAGTAKPGGLAMATPGAPTGNAVLSIVSGLPTPAGTLNPLAVRPYVLLRDTLGGAMAKGGVQVPAGMTPLKVLGSACAGGKGSLDCQKVLQAVNAETASATRSDATGKANFPGVPPGTYYLMISTVYNNHPIYWDAKVDLKAGANSLTLDQRNATPLN